jgi:hypothetical protein
MSPRHIIQRLRDRLSDSRFFTLSLTFHVILVAAFGTKVLFEITAEPADITSHELVLSDQASSVVACPGNNLPITPVLDPLKVPETSQPNTPMQDIVRTIKPDAAVFVFSSGIPTPDPKLAATPVPPSTTVTSGELTKADLARIKDFTDPWADPRESRKPINQRNFTFTAFIGKYSKGNWNANVRVQNGQITGGSLPNLLYVTSSWTKNRIQTNERAVKALALDSPELLSEKPPFIYLTGTRDFQLTDAEIENLRLYIRSGGAVWGDSAVPGQRSAFDKAFRREMKRVLPDGAQDFEQLSDKHPVFAAGYYPQVKNYYDSGLEVLRWNGEIAVLHTTNDYGDMWRIGLDKDGKIDTARNERGEYVALDPVLWNLRGSYIRNVEAPAVDAAYKFGINVIAHLLTRWENRIAQGAKL